MYINPVKQIDMSIILCILISKQGIEVAARLNIHSQSVFTYVHHFNQGNMNRLLEADVKQ